MLVIVLNEIPKGRFYGGITNDFRVISCDCLMDCVHFNDYDSAVYVFIQLGKLGFSCCITEVAN